MKTINTALIESVRATPDPHTVLGFALDQPCIGFATGNGGLAVTGWVILGDGQPCILEVTCDERTIARVPVSGARPDVGMAFPQVPVAGTSGFRVHIGLHTIPQRFTLKVAAVDDAGNRTSLATIQGVQDRVQGEGSDEPNPLLILGMGRSGTTWLMRLLSEHPSIIADVRYPYETRVAQYFAHMSKVLSDPADPNNPERRVRFVHDMETVYRNPFFTLDEEGAAWFGNGYLACLDTFVRSAAKGYYRMLARQQSRKRVRYFVEKAFHAWPIPMDAAFPDTRRIFLVRDQRDVFCSARAFNNKRGIRQFGRELASTDEEHIGELGRRASAFLNQWQRLHDSSILVRYEDLIEAPVPQLTRLFDHLGLDADAGLISELLTRAGFDTPELRAHRTVLDPGASVGRWRNELDPDLVTHCNRVFGSWNDAFGYQA